MQVVNINEAKSHLSQLIKHALAGDEVIIARANEPLVRLEPYAHNTRPRTGGQWAGRVTLGPDFELSDAEIDAMFGGAVRPESQ